MKQQISVGDRVVVYTMPLLARLVMDHDIGDMGEVMAVCWCVTTEQLEKLSVIGEIDVLLRVQFDDGGKECFPRSALRKLPGQKDKLVDWDKIPKPWEIGVTG